MHCEHPQAREELGRVKQIRVHGPNDVRLDDVAPPPPGPRDALVRMAACGICGTDVSFVHMGGITGQPMALGHEMAGVVEWVGCRGGAMRPPVTGSSSIPPTTSWAG